MDTEIPAARGETAPAGRTPELVLFPILRAILDRFRLFIVLPILTTFLVVAGSFIFGRKFTATALLRPQLESGLPAGLSGLGSQLMGLMRLGSGETLDYYVKLLQSRTLLEEVASATYRSATKGELTLLEYYETKGTPADRLNAAVDRLARDTKVEPDARAGVIELSFSATEPSLAEQVVRRYLVALNAFNTERRQSAARAEREFLERTLAAVRDSLRSAELALETFQERNKRATSPSLRMLEARLQRDLSEKQQLFLQLSQELARARIEEVRNTPVVTILDAPEGSALPARLGLPIQLFLGVTLGLVMASLIVLLLSYRDYVSRSYPDQYRALVRSGSDVLRQIRSRRILQRRKRQVAGGG